MRPLSLLLAPPLLFLAGCAALVVKPDDSYAQVGAKVVTRIVLGVSTLGISEMEIAEAREKWEADQELAEYRRSLTWLVNNDKLTALEAETLFLQYRQSLAERIKANRIRRYEAYQAMAQGLQGAGQALQGGGGGYSDGPPTVLLPGNRPGNQSVTFTDPMTGRVSNANIQTMPNGSQSYLFTDPYTGRSKSGFLSAPTGSMRNYSITDAQTGQTQSGTINTFPSTP